MSQAKASWPAPMYDVVRKHNVAAGEDRVVTHVLDDAGLAEPHGDDVVVNVEVAQHRRAVVVLAGLLDSGDAIGVVGDHVVVHLNIRSRLRSGSPIPTAIRL